MEKQESFLLVSFHPGDMWNESLCFKGCCRPEYRHVEGAQVVEVCVSREDAARKIAQLNERMCAQQDARDLPLYLRWEHRLFSVGPLGDDFDPYSEIPEDIQERTREIQAGFEAERKRAAEARREAEEVEKRRIRAEKVAEEEREERALLAELQAKYASATKGGDL